AVARQVDQEQAGAEVEEVDLPRVTRARRGARQRAAAGQRVDQARLADIGAAGEGDLGQRARDQRVERGCAGDELARTGEQLARRLDRFRRTALGSLRGHQPFFLPPFLPPPFAGKAAVAASALAAAALACALEPIGVPWRRMIVYCWQIDRVLLHAQ